MAALLQQVGRREVDQHAARRQCQAHGAERGPHPFARLADRLVGQADDQEAPAMPLEICTCTSTGTASMPEKAKVRTRAMAAAERSAVTDCRPGRLRAIPSTEG